MRRQYFYWTYLVLGIVLTIYGGYSLIYNADHGKDIPILGLVFLIVGSVMLLTYFILGFITIYRKTKNEKNNEPLEAEIEEVEVIKKEEPQPEIEEVKEEEPVKPVKKNVNSDEVTYVRSSYSAPRGFSGGSGYVKQVGYGPVLRINEAEILDMRSNTYYRIEGNIVNMNGYGPAYEISGNRIKLAFGSYLYEISGGNVYKVFGGFYASISSGYLQTHDLSEKYEFTDSFNLKQQLAIVAILFGSY